MDLQQAVNQLAYITQQERDNRLSVIYGYIQLLQHGKEDIAVFLQVLTRKHPLFLNEGHWAGAHKIINELKQTHYFLYLKIIAAWNELNANFYITTTSFVKYLTPLYHNQLDQLYQERIAVPFQLQTEICIKTMRKAVPPEEVRPTLS